MEDLEKRRKPAFGQKKQTKTKKKTQRKARNEEHRKRKKNHGSQESGHRKAQHARGRSEVESVELEQKARKENKRADNATGWWPSPGRAAK